MNEWEKALLQIGISVVASLAILYLSKWLSGPRLKIVPHEADYGHFKTRELQYSGSTVTHRPLGPDAKPIIQEQYPSIYGDVTYVRIGVTNSGRGSALKCQGYLTGVEIEGTSKIFTPLFFDAIPLVWSYLEAASTLDIPRRIVAHLDVLVARKGEKADTLAPCLTIIPTRYANLFDSTSKYRLTIVVTAENANPISSRWIIEWPGNWNQLKVSPDNP